MIDKHLAEEKIESGWIRARFDFDVLAINEKKTKEALEELMDRLDKDHRVKMYKKEFSDIKRVEKPLKDIEFGYSMTCEVELVSNKFEDLVGIVLEYGPSASEVLAPGKVSFPISEAQSILNNVSMMMHRFAAAGLGGIVLVGKKE